MKHPMSRKHRRNMDRWIRSLRSGDFKQGRGTLLQLTVKQGADPIEHPPVSKKNCCLGVLLEVTPNNPCLHNLELTTDHDYQGRLDGYRSKDDTLSVDEFKELTGLTGQLLAPTEIEDEDDEVGDEMVVDGYLDSLISFNDDTGQNHKGFKGIALHLERTMNKIDPHWRVGL